MIKKNQTQTDFMPLTLLNKEDANEPVGSKVPNDKVAVYSNIVL